MDKKREQEKRSRLMAEALEKIAWGPPYGGGRFYSKREAAEIARKALEDVNFSLRVEVEAISMCLDKLENKVDGSRGCG